MTVTGAQIAADAARYIGASYTFGGNASKIGDWDCSLPSSFVSYVLGHDLGLALPGGNWGDAGFPPNSHGPLVTSFSSWSGATTIPGPPSPGDLCIWVGSGSSGHIGIAQSATTMVSALNTQYGTISSGIVGWGPAGAPLIYRRVDGVPAGTSTTTTSAFSLLGLPKAVVVALITAGAEVIGVLLLGTAAVAGAALLIAYAARRHL